MHVYALPSFFFSVTPSALKLTPDQAEKLQSISNEIHQEALQVYIYISNEIHQEALQVYRYI
jgi:hypothetical protein